MHWLGAALALTAIGSGLWIVYGRPSAGLSIDASAWRYSLHKTIGVATALYLLARLAVMARGGFAPAGGRSIEILAAAATQGFMLAALAILPLSGLAQHMLIQGAAPIWLFPVEAARAFLAGHNLLPPADPLQAARLGRVHVALGWGLIAALLLHAGAALKHHVIDRDDVLARMVGRPAVVDRRDGVATSAALRMRRGGLAAGMGLAGLLAALALVLADPHSPASGAPPLKEETRQQQPSAETWRWIADPRESRLEIEGEQAGAPFTALFRAFDVDIVFDPANPEKASILAQIAANSFFSGLSDRDAIVHGEDWLDARRHPVVRWHAQGAERIDETRFRARGELTIGLSSAPVELVFSLAISGAVATAQGEASFPRAALALGRGETGAAEIAGPMIKVRTRIRAHRAAP